MRAIRAADRGTMEELDKSALGRRIRAIRSLAGLRQWELAKLLGTTQSAVHKYEHGVVPEPRRLVELARIGNTSIEWILTGRHWENGSQEQPRLSPELLETARALRSLGPREIESLDEALRILREVVRVLEEGTRDLAAFDPAALAVSLGRLAPETLRLLERAAQIQQAVLRRVTSESIARLGEALAPAPEASEAGPRSN